MTRHEPTDRRDSPIDLNSYSTIDGRTVHRQPDLFRDEDTIAVDAVDERHAVAWQMLQTDPILRGYFTEGRSLATVARLLQCHRSTALRRLRRYLDRDVRLKIVAAVAYRTSLANDGGTFDVRTGRSIVEDAWAVGTRKFGRRSPTLSPSLIEEYLTDGPPDLPLGTFFSSGTWDLDRVRLVHDQSKAIRIAIDEDQDSILHLLTRRTITLSTRIAA